MIRSFRDKRAAAVFGGRLPKGVPTDVAKVARRLLRMIDNAWRLDDLQAPLGANRGQRSLRITEDWCVCFVWRHNDAHDVRIVRQGYLATPDRILRHGLVDTDLSDATTGANLPNVGPGDVLRHHFMEALGLSAHSLALAIDVPRNLINGILNDARAVIADTAVMFGLIFATSAEFWIGLQLACDLEEARKIRFLRYRRQFIASDRQPVTPAVTTTRLRGWITELTSP